MCLCVLLWLLEDTPASADPLDDVVMFCEEVLAPQGWRRARSIIFRRSWIKPTLPQRLTRARSRRNGSTELNDCIANANDFETCVSDARVSVRVQLLEKSRVQALDKLEKETADVSSRDSGGTTNVIVDLKFQGKVLSRMQTRLLMCLQKASDHFGRNPDRFFENVSSRPRPSLVTLLAAAKLGSVCPAVCNLSSAASSDVVVSPAADADAKRQCE